MPRYPVGARFYLLTIEPVNGSYYAIHFDGIEQESLAASVDIPTHPVDTGFSHDTSVSVPVVYNVTAYLATPLKGDVPDDGLARPTRFEPYLSNPAIPVNVVPRFRGGGQMLTTKLVWDALLTIRGAPLAIFTSRFGVLKTYKMTDASMNHGAPGRTDFTLVFQEYTQATAAEVRLPKIEALKPTKKGRVAPPEDPFEDPGSSEDESIWHATVASKLVVPDDYDPRFTLPHKPHLPPVGGGIQLESIYKPPTIINHPSAGRRF